MKSAFMSYKYEDNNRLNDLISQIRNGNNSLSLEARKEDQDVRQKGENAIRAYIKSKMRGVDVVLLLLGRDTHSSLWVQYEIEVAKSQGIPIVCIRFEDGGLPPNINGGRYVIVNFNWKEIQSAIDRLT